MGYTIVSGNTPSVVALHKNHAIVFIENVGIQRQISILNLNMPKSKWGDAEEPTINNISIKLEKIILNSLF